MLIEGNALKAGNRLRQRRLAHEFWMVGARKLEAVCITDFGRRAGAAGVGRKNRSGALCGLLIDVMEASKHRYCDHLSTLSASMRYTCRPRRGRTLSNRTMRPPVVDITDIRDLCSREHRCSDDKEPASGA
jgi:hypothetical protein